jgi:hypothetical protein
MTRSRLHALYLAASTLACGATAVYARIAIGRMTTAAVFLVGSTAVLCAVLATLYRAARALIEDPAADEVTVVTGRRRKELEREKALLLKALKELEFDHEMRKVSDADFREIGGQYRARAVRVLRQLDAEGGDYRALIEKEVRARRGGRDGASVSGAATSDAPSPDQSSPSSPPATAVSGSLPRCAKCGTTNDEDADFCKKCGNRLAAEAKAAT